MKRCGWDKGGAWQREVWRDMSSRGARGQMWCQADSERKDSCSAESQGWCWTRMAKTCVSVSGPWAPCGLGQTRSLRPSYGWAPATVLPLVWLWLSCRIHKRSIKFTIGLWGLNLAQALSKCRKEAVVVLRWPALPCSVSPFLLLLFCCPLLLGEDFPCQRLCSIPPLFNQAGPFPQFRDIHQSVIKQIFIKRPPSATLYSGGTEMEDR